MKIVSSFFALIILANTCYYGVYQVLLFKAKWKSSVLVHNRVQPNHLITFQLSAQEGKIFDQEEVIFKGTLYDVVQKIYIHDSIRVYLYPDSEEQSILDKLANCFKTDETYFVPIGDKFFQIRTFHGIQDQISHRLVVYSKTYRLLFCLSYSLRNISEFLDLFHRVLTPPPERFQ